MVTGSDSTLLPIQHLFAIDRAVAAGSDLLDKATLSVVLVLQGRGGVVSHVRGADGFIRSSLLGAGPSGQDAWHSPAGNWR